MRTGNNLHITFKQRFVVGSRSTVRPVVTVSIRFAVAVSRGVTAAISIILIVAVAGVHIVNRTIIQSIGSKRTAVSTSFYFYWLISILSL